MAFSFRNDQNGIDHLRSPMVQPTQLWGHYSKTSQRGETQHGFLSATRYPHWRCRGLLFRSTPHQLCTMGVSHTKLTPTQRLPVKQRGPQSNRDAQARPLQEARKTTPPAMLPDGHWAATQRLMTEASPQFCQAPLNPSISTPLCPMKRTLGRSHLLSSMCL